MVKILDFDLHVCKMNALGKTHVNCIVRIGKMQTSDFRI